MKPAACPRLFEAEAMRDGRLAGAELVSFARHTTLCSACRREVQALESLAEALRATAPGGAPADELHVLRERTRLIAAFDGTLVAPPRRTGAARRMLWPVAAAVLIAGAFALSRARTSPPAVRSPSVVVHADSGAAWSRRTEREHERVVLDRGALWIHVEHARSAPALLVSLPDGELEDTGTTFTVSAAAGRTIRVAVTEGSVVLRIRGRPAVAIGAGATWTPEPEPRPSTHTGTLAAPRSSPSAVAAADPARRARLFSRAPARQGQSSIDRPAVPLDAPDLATEFRTAVAALDAGANREAAGAFASFLARHPRDPRAEDAAYLRVIALQRCGADGDTKRAAQEYLRLYPAGFRHVEMENLLR